MHLSTREQSQNSNPSLSDSRALIFFCQFWPHVMRVEKSLEKIVIDHEELPCWKKRADFCFPWSCYFTPIS